jgi:hypothetical protein
MQTNRFPHSLPLWARVPFFLSALLFAALPASLFFRGITHEIFLALGLVGLGGTAIALTIHGLLLGHLPPDPLGRLPAAPGRNPTFYGFSLFLIACCGLGALLLGVSGLIHNLPKVAAL